MKKSIALSFAAGLMTGALLFGGTVAYATGILAERTNNCIYVDGRKMQLEAYVK